MSEAPDAATLQSLVQQSMDQTNADNAYDPNKAGYISDFGKLAEMDPSGKLVSFALNSFPVQGPGPGAPGHGPSQTYYPNLGYAPEGPSQSSAWGHVLSMIAPFMPLAYGGDLAAILGTSTKVADALISGGLGAASGGLQGGLPGALMGGLGGGLGSLGGSGLGSLLGGGAGGVAGDAAGAAGAAAGSGIAGALPGTVSELVIPGITNALGGLAGAGGALGAGAFTGFGGGPPGGNLSPAGGPTAGDPLLSGAGPGSLPYDPLGIGGGLGDQLGGGSGPSTSTSPNGLGPEVDPLTVTAAPGNGLDLANLGGVLGNVGPFDKPITYDNGPNQGDVNKDLGKVFDSLIKSLGGGAGGIVSTHPANGGGGGLGPGPGGGPGGPGGGGPGGGGPGSLPSLPNMAGPGGAGGGGPMPLINGGPGGGSGVGPGGPGNLDLQGSLAPDIYPWTSGGGL